MTFGAWLAGARERAGLTQEALAERAGVSKNYISSLERDLPHHESGRLPVPRPDVVRALAAALDRAEGEAILAAYLPHSGGPVAGVYQLIGARLRLRRLELGLSEGDAAGAIGVAEADYRAYEAGSRVIPVDHLVQLARRFAQALEWFCGEDGAEFDDEEELLAFWRQAPAGARGAARLMLRAAVREAEQEEVTHGRRAG